MLYDVARYRKKKSWIILIQNNTLLYCPFHIVEKLIFPSSIWIFCLFTVKRENANSSTMSSFPVAIYFVLGTLALAFCLLCFSTNKQAIKQNKYNPVMKCLFLNNTSNRFNFIVTWTVRKTCELWRRKGTITLICRKTKDCRQHDLATYVTWALKEVRSIKGATYEVIIY